MKTNMEKATPIYSIEDNFNSSSLCSYFLRDGIRIAGIDVLFDGKNNEKIRIDTRKEWNGIVNAVNSHDVLVKAVTELLAYIEADNTLKVEMYPQSIKFAKDTLNKANGKE